jgi:hypothetical protein
MRRDSSVSIATDYGLDSRGIGDRVPLGALFFSSPRHPDRLLGPSSLLSNLYGGAVSPGVMLTTHLQVLPRLRIRGSIHPIPHTSSWRSAQLVKRRDYFTFTLTRRSLSRFRIEARIIPVVTRLSIYCVPNIYEFTSSTGSDVFHYVIIRNLLDSVFNQL